MITKIKYRRDHNTRKILYDMDFGIVNLILVKKV